MKAFTSYYAALLLVPVLGLLAACGSAPQQTPSTTQDPNQAMVSPSDVPSFGAAQKALAQLQNDVRDEPVDCLKQLTSGLQAPNCGTSADGNSVADGNSYTVNSTLPASLQQSDLILRQVLGSLDTQGSEACLASWATNVQGLEKNYDQCVQSGFQCSTDTATNCTELNLQVSAPLSGKVCVSPGLQCQTLTDPSHPEQLARCTGAAPGVIGTATEVTLPGATPITNLGTCTQSANCLVVLNKSSLPPGFTPDPNSGVALGLELQCQ